MAAKTDVKPTVYRVVANNEKGDYGILVAVYADDPEETLQAYLRTTVVRVIGEPEVVEMDAARKGIDAHIEPIKEAPGFAVRNRLRLSTFDRVLKDPRQAL